MLNGCGYALFGVPPGDLETTWRDDAVLSSPGLSPLLGRNNISTIAATTEANFLSSDISVRRFSKTRLYTPGRILHIVSRKKTRQERLALINFIYLDFYVVFIFLGKQALVAQLMKCDGQRPKTLWI